MSMGHISSASFQGWRTPRALAERLVAEYGCVLDAAADKDNAVCATFYDGEEGSDGLKQPWIAPEAGVWVNPPYEDPTAWAIKAREEVFFVESCARVVMLLPAAVGTKWFTHACHLGEVHIFDERIRFDLPPRETLPLALQEVLYRQSARSGAWVPKTSPGGGNALVIFEVGRPVGVRALRSTKTGDILQDFTDGRRVV